MNDAEFARQKERIIALADWWVPKIGLAWWQIDLVYARDDFEVHGEPSPEAVAKTHANWRYGTAAITWNMPLVAQQSDGDLETAFVHELQHIFLNEARENGDDWLDHEERVASTYTKAFLWLRDILSEPPARVVSPDTSADVHYSPAPPPQRNGARRHARASA